MHVQSESMDRASTVLKIRDVHFNANWHYNCLLCILSLASEKKELTQSIKLKYILLGGSNGHLDDDE
jgi:hypothetical protein